MTDWLVIFCGLHLHQIPVTRTFREFSLVKQ
nr:MAG TPA: hypothetical protein [Caudoviricetes sp.]